MSNKILVFDKEARQKLSRGADTLARAVVSTLGPRSKNVVIDRPYPGPVVLHDGVSIAREVKLKDPIENMGAQLLKEAASKTNDLAGDGTTTATLLANTILQKGLPMIEGGIVDGVVQGNVNAMVVKEELEKYAEQITKKLDEIAKPVKKKADRVKVATISAASEEIGELVATALEKVGEKGLVLVEEGSDFKTNVEHKEGMEFDNGYLSGYLVTDPHRMVAHYTGGGHKVLLTDQVISDGEALAPIIQEMLSKCPGKALLVIAADVVGPALKAMVLTKLKMGAPLVAVMAPDYADRRKEMLEDLAILTGGRVISGDKGELIKDVKLGDLGTLKTIMVTQNSTSIAPEFPDNDEIEDRCEAIKSQIAIETNTMKLDRLKERLAKLSNGVAVINVGGGSQSEIDERKERVIDAVYATKAAISDGIVAGGGVALAHIASNLELIGDVRIFNLVRDVLFTPMTTLLQNSGDDETQVMEEISKIESPTGEIGYNVVTKKIGNMIEMGVIDPVKVTKLAVRHAFSVGSMLLTTACGIADEVDNTIQKIRVVQ